MYRKSEPDYQSNDSLKVPKKKREISLILFLNYSRDQGSKREPNEEEKTQRLFVIVPKTMTDNELFTYFKTFGDIDYASVMRDRETRESKGFAYVKYFKWVTFQQNMIKKTNFSQVFTCS